MNKQELINRVQLSGGRSAWSRGVKEYALDLLATLDDTDITRQRELERRLLNGAVDWRQYSYGGCALIRDTHIARRLCNNTELRITKGGERRPNKEESWLDVQARALFQAAELIKDIFLQGA